MDTEIHLPTNHPLMTDAFPGLEGIELLFNQYEATDSTVIGTDPLEEEDDDDFEKINGDFEKQTSQPRSEIETIVSDLLNNLVTDVAENRAAKGKLQLKLPPLPEKMLSTHCLGMLADASPNKLRKASAFSECSLKTADTHGLCSESNLLNSGSQTPASFTRILPESSSQLDVPPSNFTEELPLLESKLEQLQEEQLKHTSASASYSLNLGHETKPDGCTQAAPQNISLMNTRLFNNDPDQISSQCASEDVQIVDQRNDEEERNQEFEAKYQKACQSAKKLLEALSTENKAELRKKIEKTLSTTPSKKITKEDFDKFYQTRVKEHQKKKNQWLKQQQEEKTKQELAEIHDPTINKNKGPVDRPFFQRLETFTSQKERKLSELRKEAAMKKEIEEVKELTFKPSLISKKQLPRPSQIVTHKTPEPNRELEECTFKPRINQHSKRLSSKINQVLGSEVVSRLYAYKERKDEELEKRRKESQPTFTPNSKTRKKKFELTEETMRSSQFKSRDFCSPVSQKPPSGRNTSPRLTISNPSELASRQRSIQPHDFMREVHSTRAYYSVSPQRNEFSSVPRTSCADNEEIETGSPKFNDGPSDGELLDLLLETKDMLYKDERKIYDIIEAMQARKSELEGELKEKQSNSPDPDELAEMQSNIELMRLNLETLQESFQQVIKQNQSQLGLVEELAKEKPADDECITQTKQSTRETMEEKKVSNTSAGIRHPSFQIDSQNCFFEQKVTSSPVKQEDNLTSTEQRRNENVVENKEELKLPVESNVNSDDEQHGCVSNPSRVQKKTRRPRSQRFSSGCNTPFSNSILANDSNQQGSQFYSSSQPNIFEQVQELETQKTEEKVDKENESEAEAEERQSPCSRLDSHKPSDDGIDNDPFTKPHNNSELSLQYSHNLFDQTESLIEGHYACNQSYSLNFTKTIKENTAKGMLRNENSSIMIQSQLEDESLMQIYKERVHEEKMNECSHQPEEHKEDPQPPTHKRESPERQLKTIVQAQKGHNLDQMAIQERIAENLEQLARSKIIERKIDAYYDCTNSIQEESEADSPSISFITELSKESSMDNGETARTSEIQTIDYSSLEKSVSTPKRKFLIEVPSSKSVKTVTEVQKGVQRNSSPLKSPSEKTNGSLIRSQCSDTSLTKIASERSESGKEGVSVSNAEKKPRNNKMQIEHVAAVHICQSPMTESERHSPVETKRKQSRTELVNILLKYIPKQLVIKDKEKLVQTYNGTRSPSNC